MFIGKSIFKFKRRARTCNEKLALKERFRNSTISLEECVSAYVDFIFQILLLLLLFLRN